MYVFIKDFMFECFFVCMYVLMYVIIHLILLYCMAEVKLVSLALLCSTYMLVVVMKCMYNFI
jgi:hypothetical protein